jgi:hypothetical protein
LVQQISHGEAQRIEIVLNPQQLERVPPVSVEHLLLQFPHYAHLAHDVGGIRHYGQEDDD